ncbi:MAG: hypothetical protein MZW92_72625 [Comamonadaceae bacterium]|nr:hypothetical protein [Comamonadaceae bacterium]
MIEPHRPDPKPPRAARRGPRSSSSTPANRVRAPTSGSSRTAATMRRKEHPRHPDPGRDPGLGHHRLAWTATDEAAAVQAIVELIDGRFGEKE